MEDAIIAVLYLTVTAYFQKTYVDLLGKHVLTVPYTDRF